MAELTPFQTVGPFFAICLSADGCAHVATEQAIGRHITIEGTMRDGNGVVIPDALVEIWQANAEGRYAHPDDHQQKALDPNFTGYGRAPTDGDGRFSLATVMPGRVPGPDNTLQAPHILLGILARGVLTRLVTRVYFDDEPSNAEDAVLAMVPDTRRHTLVARREGGDVYRFDIVLQGDEETVFFDV